MIAERCRRGPRVTKLHPNANDPRMRYAVKPGSTRMLLLDAVR
jgi:hypothetical protein